MKSRTDTNSNAPNLGVGLNALQEQAKGVVEELVLAESSAHGLPEIS